MADHCVDRSPTPGGGRFLALREEINDGSNCRKLSATMGREDGGGHRSAVPIGQHVTQRASSQGRRGNRARDRGNAKRGFRRSQQDDGLVRKKPRNWSDCHFSAVGSVEIPDLRKGRGEEAVMVRKVGG